ncbi:hypothetical protein V6N11_061302 [Hibiscus sabdariffa]|uniref:Uncharacterized protein n=1 Tax=Hibiscus sabdariffa TaxID=183260 RepID=A0ABR2NVU7_9ROSI
MNGVELVDCDSKGVLTISGKGKPMIIVKKVESWGRKAELLSLDQSPESESQTNNHRCCRCDSDSDSNSDNKSNSLNEASNGQSTESGAKKWCFGLFRKKDKPKVKMVKAPPSTADALSRLQFPRFPMLDYGGGPVPYYQPFRPYHPPPMMGRPPGPGPLHYPYGVMHPPFMPPYGSFHPRPPPKYNPMIHYTSYADDYAPW